MIPSVHVSMVCDATCSNLQSGDPMATTSRNIARAADVDNTCDSSIFFSTSRFQCQATKMSMLSFLFKIPTCKATRFPFTRRIRPCAEAVIAIAIVVRFWKNSTVIKAARSPSARGSCHVVVAERIISRTCPLRCLLLCLRRGLSGLRS